MNNEPATRFLVFGCAVLSAAAAYGEAPGPQDSRIELPAGDGRLILERSCTNCHDLAGLAAYKGYYDGDRWRALIDTMVSHGAELDEAQIALLTDYLVEHFGPGTL